MEKHRLELIKARAELIAQAVNYGIFDVSIDGIEPSDPLYARAIHERIMQHVEGIVYHSQQLIEGESDG